MSTELVRASGSNTAIIRHSDEITDIERLGRMLSSSGYFTDARDAAQAAVKVMAGRELGIPPVASMMGISIIKGKVAIGGNLIAACIRAHGYDYRHKQFDTKGCVLTFLSKPDPSGKREVLGESSFTEEDAKTAGVFSDMYRKFPRNMYFNRSISNGAKWYTPDVFGGAPVYTPEELGAKVDGDGELLMDEPEPQRQETRQEVLDRKLDEARAAGINVDQYSNGKGPKPTPRTTQTAEPEHPLVAQLWSQMSGRFEALAVFKKLKEEFVRVLGDQDGTVKYYELLNRHGVEKSDQFKTMKPAKNCVKDMVLALQSLEARSEVIDAVVEEPTEAQVAE